MNLLITKDLSFAYDNKKTVFSDVSFSLSNGEILTIIGPNGIGKSTLLRCLLGVSKPTAGEILVDGKPIQNYNRREIAHQIAVVQQDYHLNVDISVRDYLLTARASYLGKFEMPGKTDEKLVVNNLKKYQLFSTYHQSFNDLSGGQQQLLTIIRAVIQQPQILLLDEPMSSLDLKRQAEVIQLLKKLSEMGMGIIMTTHLPDHAFMLGGQIGLFNQNGHLQIGKQKDLATEKNLSQIYGTRVKLIYLPHLHRYTCQLQI